MHNNQPAKLNNIKDNDVHRYSKSKIAFGMLETNIISKVITVKLIPTICIQNADQYSDLFTLTGQLIQTI